MLRPLLYLSALIGLSGAVTFSNSKELNITSCPITFFGKKYINLYVNSSNSLLAVCFNGFYGTQPNLDCITGPGTKANTLTFEIRSPTSKESSSFRLFLTPVTSVLKCLSVLSWTYGQIDYFKLANFGTEAGLSYNSLLDGTFTFDILVDGKRFDNVSMVNDANRKQYNLYFDLTGCRYAGDVFKSETDMTDIPDTCSDRKCNEIGVIASTQLCGPKERCKHNNTCFFESICTLTGDTVIDFEGGVGFVPDRCGYTLLSFEEFDILGYFMERRRKDVYLLDSVTLKIRTDKLVEIHLEQDGTVQLDNTTLLLNDSIRLVHGVEISQNQTGITATMETSSNYTISLFFDGNTAQIFLTGIGTGNHPSGSGICYNSTIDWKDKNLSSKSAKGCEIKHTDTADSKINCTMMTERCNLLKEATFTACHKHIKPDPYVTACSKALCKYPALDGFNCQFLEAYARACSLGRDETLEGWRSNASCKPRQAFCQDQVCSGHEFCGEKTVGGETGCLCRAIFASPYKSTGTFGDAEVCRASSASVTLAGCLLEGKGIDYSVLHLNDETCTGQIDELNHMVSFSFNSTNTCGTEVKTNDSQIIYKNAIMTKNNSDIISRTSQVYIDFSCYYTQPDIKNMSLRIQDNSVIQHITSGPWTYSLTMKAYTNADRTQAVDYSTGVQLNQMIWVELATDGLDSGLVTLVTDSCWATHQASPDGSPSYYLIIKGCANPTDNTVKVEGNGMGTSNYFSFKVFQFSKVSGDIYLHCKLHLCGRDNKNCAPTCNKRRRRFARSTYMNEAPAFISMAWIK